MIENLVGRYEKAENEAVLQNANSTGRTPARLTFADHEDGLVACDCAAGVREGMEGLGGVHRRSMAR